MKSLKPINIAALGLECGEVPYWIPEENSFYFTDTEKRSIYVYSTPDQRIRRIPVPYQFQCIAKRNSGGWIGTAVRGVVLWNPEDSSCEFIGNPEAGKPGMLFNDGTVSPEGDFIFGTYDVENLEEPKGSLYIVRQNHQIELLEPGFAVPNGMAFGIDGKTFYISEQFGRRVLLFDWDPRAGKLTNKRVFTEFSEEQGMPDGLIIDSEGYIWVAHWQGWRVTRFTPAGSIDMEISLPAATATCMVFAGEKLEELYITTAKKCVAEEDLKKGPEAGDVFKAVPGCTGRIENRFKG